MTMKWWWGVILSLVIYSASAIVSIMSATSGFAAWTVFVVGGVLYLLVQLWFLRPTRIEEVSRKRFLMSLLLCGIKQQYLSYLQTRGIQAPAVRINVMVPVIERRFSAPRVIKILYTDGTEAFSDEEKRDCWERGEGKAGAAWLAREQALYAADVRSPDSAMERMAKDKYQRYEKLQSIMSTPIFLSEAVIGVLNLDSEEDSSRTYIADNTVKTILYNAAQELALVIPAEGVPADGVRW